VVEVELDRKVIFVLVDCKEVVWFGGVCRGEESKVDFLGWEIGLRGCWL